ncbi:DNA polymerase III, delta subunit [Alkalibacterium putridalgicola]|uniref:DNA polymerase III subunit delta n=1 Tax=Alkalibacterium putridalgicola TaxID=426703 RepID=A0A1H7Q7S5_9LACT|nr:DNA polymerase III subunit delta [Alkalibacterium putridalgicola]GEK88023.1 DNA polymerase III subunit delta [Alkalibacterium putridalgicola]SEL43555.1 DNA polymerase III, delta subunit [Alkalibacterium putridalgicola]
MKTVLKQIDKIKKGQLKPVYAVIGTERMLIEEVTASLTETIRAGQEDDMNIMHFDLTETSIDDVIFEAESFPFFGGKKLIFVHSSYIFTGKKVSAAVKHTPSLVENYLNDPSDFSILVFIAPYDKLDKRKKVTKTLLKSAEVIDVTPASEKDTADYLKSYCQSSGYSMSRESFERLLQLTDRNLSKAKNELDKLMVYHIEDKEISMESIDKLVSKSLEQNIFELNERVLKKNVKQSIELYQDLLHQKEDPIKILALMISQFRLLLQVKILRKKGYQQADIAGILKIHPYRVKLALQTEKRFKQEILSQAHRYLITADYEIKSGKVNAEMQIELFIWKFSTMTE